MGRYIYCFALLISQSLMAQQINIITYNVENLFDYEDDTTTRDDDFLPEGKKHWNANRYSTKLQKLDSALTINGIPDIIGLIEIENKKVIEDLSKQSQLGQKEFKILHKDSPDMRGIDCAVLYNPEKIKLLAFQTIPVTIDSLPEFKTRDIVYAKLLIGRKDTIHYFVNHWPSRRGGQEKSNFKRVHAATCLMNVSDSIILKNKKAKIIIMGDFNDMPNNESIQLLTRKNILENLTPGENDTIGTYNYRGRWNMLDQCIVSKSVIAGKGKNIADGYPYIPINFEPFFTTYKGVKVPYRTYGGSKYLAGYSDHLWVQIILH